MEEKSPLDQQVPPRADGLNHALAAHISGKAARLALSAYDKQVRARRA